jgi:hypothetical protein
MGESCGMNVRVLTRKLEKRNTWNFFGAYGRIISEWMFGK